MDLGLLFLRVRKMDAGTYFCQTVEHGFVHTVRKITLEVVEEERVEEMFHKDLEEDGPPKMPCPAQSIIPQGAKPWYKEFLQLIGYSNFQRVEEYCEKVWCTDKKRKKLKMSPSKWKYANPQEKKLRPKAEHYRLPRHTLDSWHRDTASWLLKNLCLEPKTNKMRNHPASYRLTDFCNTEMTVKVLW